MFEELDRHARMLEGPNSVNPGHSGQAKYGRTNADIHSHEDAPDRDVNHLQDTNDNSGEFAVHLKVPGLM